VFLLCFCFLIFSLAFNSIRAYLTHLWLLYPDVLQCPGRIEPSSGGEESPLWSSLHHALLLCGRLCSLSLWRSRPFQDLQGAGGVSTWSRDYYLLRCNLYHEIIIYWDVIYRQWLYILVKLENVRQFSGFFFFL
jgi:hypothetical protein